MLWLTAFLIAENSPLLFILGRKETQFL